MRYLCFDSALNEVYTLLLLQKSLPNHICLFAGTKDETIWHVAPWLFQLTAENIYTTWQQDPNCHLDRCLIIDSKTSLTELKEHLQQFVYKNKNNQTFYNRFWDAAILPSLLEKMSVEAVTDFFETIDAIYINDDIGFWKLSLNHKCRLIKEPISIVQIFPSDADTANTIAPPSTNTATTSPNPRRRFFSE